MTRIGFVIFTIDKAPIPEGIRNIWCGVVEGGRNVQAMFELIGIGVIDKKPALLRYRRIA